jgi:hypothetical protein
MPLFALLWLLIHSEVPRVNGFGRSFNDKAPRLLAGIIAIA